MIRRNKDIAKQNVDEIYRIIDIAFICKTRDTTGLRYVHAPIYLVIETGWRHGIEALSALLSFVRKIHRQQWIPLRGQWWWASDAEF